MSPTRRPNRNVPRCPRRPLSPRAPRGILTACVALTLLVVAAIGRPSRADDPPRSEHDLLHQRYAEARLALAELDLEKATILDREGQGGIVSDYDWRRLRSRVAVLRELVAISRDRPHGTGLDGQRARAKAVAKVAEEDLEQARAIHDRQPDPLNEIGVRRAEAKAEIARLRVALWEDPANVPSIIDEMQMQIDQLTDHVIDLLDQVDNDRISDRRRQ